MNQLRDKRVLVAGATGGLGPSIVEAMLAVGGAVIAVARRRTGLDRLRADLRQHDRLEVAECDITDPKGVERLFESVEKRAPLDAVVNASGAFAWSRLSDLDDETATRLLRVNVEGSVFVLRAAVRRMAPRGAGSIVLLAADRALEPAAGFSVYGAAKAAVTHMTQAAAVELHDAGVRINAILPGIIDTAENRRAMPDADPATWADPKAIAQAAVYLCSDDARGVSGSLLRLPGP